MATLALIPLPSSYAIAPLTLPASDTWEYWLPRFISRKAARTQLVYAAELRAFLAFIDWRPIRSLTVVLLEEYQQHLVNRGLKPNSIAMRIAAICSLISFIHRRDLSVMPTNIGAAVERVRASNELAGRILSEAEVLRMFDRTTNLRDLALLRVLYSSGCRISEALGLQWSDIVWREQDALITVLGKGSKVRTVAIYGAAIAALQAIRPAGELAGYVFVTCHGRLGPNYAVDLVRNAARRAGIDKPVSPHWLRHASATHALERNAPLPLVSRTLGHSNLATTGRYLHVRPSESMGKFLAV